MAGITAENAPNLVQTTLDELGKFKWTSIAYTLQKYPAFKQLIRKNRKKLRGGNSITWRVQVSTSGNARNVKMYETDQANVTPTLKVADVPWRHNETHWLYDVRELNMNKSSEHQILDIIKERRAAGMIDYANLIENDFWGKPNDSDDDTTPFGIDYWNVADTSATTVGLNGGNPSGFSSGAGGLSSSTYAQWDNYAVSYTNVTQSDFVDKARDSARLSGYEAPVDMPEFSDNDMETQYYTNNDVLKALENLSRQQNDQLGNDVAAMHGRTQFLRRPVNWVPQLDSNTSDPFYGIDWSVFRTVALEGEWMNETPPMRAANMHKVQQVFVDSTFNWICYDRRRLFRLDKAA